MNKSRLWQKGSEKWNHIIWSGLTVASTQMLIRMPLCDVIGYEYNYVHWRALLPALFFSIPCFINTLTTATP